MKILNKGNTTKNSFETKPKKHKDFNPVIIHYVGLAFVSLVLIVWAVSSVNLSQLGRDIDYEMSGWETKTETKTYPVSHIRITHESDYYDDNQKNAGYALVNYKALLDKGDMIALNVIKTNALEGNSDRYSYQFQVDEINYKSTKITEGDDADDELLHLFGSPNNNKFSKIKYKKGLKEPEVTVYYKLKYQHGKLKSKELKRSATLVLPE